jgi:hypothetical protein
MAILQGVCPINPRYAPQTIGGLDLRLLAESASGRHAKGSTRAHLVRSTPQELTFARRNGWSHQGHLRKLGPFRASADWLRFLNGQGDAMILIASAIAIGFSRHVGREPSQ